MAYAPFKDPIWVEVYPGRWVIHMAPMWTCYADKHGRWSVKGPCFGTHSYDQRQATGQASSLADSKTRAEKVYRAMTGD